jgi:hypothetical protein
MMQYWRLFYISNVLEILHKHYIRISTMLLYVSLVKRGIDILTGPHPRLKSFDLGHCKPCFRLRREMKMTQLLKNHLWRKQRHKHGIVIYIHSPHMGAVFIPLCTSCLVLLRLYVALVGLSFGTPPPLSEEKSNKNTRRRAITLGTDGILVAPLSPNTSHQCV